MFYAIKIRHILKVLWLLIIIVLIISGFFYTINLLYPLRYISIIKEKSEKYNLDPALVCAIINTESKFRKDAISYKGASGLMQIVKQTADWAAAEIKLKDYSYDRIFEPGINVEIGCWYIARLIKQYDGQVDVALASYNAGSGNVAKWLANKQYSQNGKTLTNIPFQETKNYIMRVNKNYTIYNWLLKYGLAR